MHRESPVPPPAETARFPALADPGRAGGPAVPAAPQEDIHVMIGTLSAAVQRYALQQAGISKTPKQVAENLVSLSFMQTALEDVAATITGMGLATETTDDPGAAAFSPRCPAEVPDDLCEDSAPSRPAAAHDHILITSPHEYSHQG